MRTLGASGSDGLPDTLPLKWTSDDCSVRIVGHQFNDSACDDTIKAKDFAVSMDPAGDLDGDGAMDLIVSAPEHYKEEKWQDYKDSLSTGVIDYPQEQDRVGQVYVFLSDSQSGTRSSLPTMSSLRPKYYTSSLPIIGKRKCGGGFIATKLTSRNVSANDQIFFSSADADFIIEGKNAPGPQQGFGNNIEAGVKLNGPTNSPDLAIHDLNDGMIYVFNDIEVDISGYLASNPYPTSPKVIWRDDDVSPSDTNILKLDATISRKPAPHDAVNHLRLYTGSSDPTSLGFPRFMNLAGDHIRDNDCELAIACDKTGGDDKAGVAVIDLTTGTPVVSSIYRPEVMSTTFNVTGSNDEDPYTRDHRIFRVWPLWYNRTQSTGGTLGNDRFDDLLIGCRQFPRRVTDTGVVNPFPNTASWNGYWTGSTSPVFGTQTMDSTHTQYDDLTVFSVGKMWLVRSAGNSAGN